ncbi:MAG: hypothetical protein SO054_05925, partial [Ruminococcus callidus]|nr:hypothetical protein [Ruminococcus callidus]
TQSACRFSVILPRNPLPDTKSACGISVQSAEKSDYASYAQALFSVSLREGEKHAWADAKSTDKIIGKY